MYPRDTRIDLLPSISMFEALSTTVSVLLQREVRDFKPYNCYYSYITNRFSNRVKKSCKKIV